MKYEQEAHFSTSYSAMSYPLLLCFYTACNRMLLDWALFYWWFYFVIV